MGRRFGMTRLTPAAGERASGAGPAAQTWPPPAAGPLVLPLAVWPARVWRARHTQARAAAEVQAGLALPSQTALAWAAPATPAEVGAMQTARLLQAAAAAAAAAQPPPLPHRRCHRRCPEAGTVASGPTAPPPLPLLLSLLPLLLRRLPEAPARAPPQLPEVSGAAGAGPLSAVAPVQGGFLGLWRGQQASARLPAAPRVALPGARCRCIAPASGGLAPPAPAAAAPRPWAPAGPRQRHYQANKEGGGH